MSAPPYPKIENLYARAADGRSLDVDVLRRDTTRLITMWLATEKIDGTNIRVSLEQEDCAHADFGQDCVGLIATCDMPWGIGFYGRTNKAQMPDFIQEYLEATFTLDKLKQLWRGQRQCSDCEGSGRKVHEPSGERFLRCDCVEPYPITLYGEAYGARIQRGGGDYRRDGDVSFRLFDVLVAEKHWLNWENVVGVAESVGVKTVPLLHAPPPLYYGMSTESIVRLARTGFKSEVAFEEGTPRLAEGIVARTDPYLFDNNGRRVVFKTKTKDF